MLQSLPRAFQTVNFILQIVVQQVFELIRQFCQFIFQFYFFAGRGILKGPKFSVQSHKNFHNKHHVLWLIGQLFLFWKYFSLFTVQK